MMKGEKKLFAFKLAAKQSQPENIRTKGDKWKARPGVSAQVCSEVRYGNFRDYDETGHADSGVFC